MKQWLRWYWYIPLVFLFTAGGIILSVIEHLFPLWVAFTPLMALALWQIFVVVAGAVVYTQIRRYYKDNMRW